MMGRARTLALSMAGAARTAPWVAGLAAEALSITGAAALALSMAGATVLALSPVEAAFAQTPERPIPEELAGTDISMPGELEDAGYGAPDALENTGITMQSGLGDADFAVQDEHETPAFPPGLDPIIAVNPLNPRLNQEQPWEITSDGRVIPQRRAPRPPIQVFRAPLTDAFSSRTENGAIELTFGGQTSLGGTLGVRVSRLETAPAVVELAVGESLALDDLTVRAYDADGELVERAPLRLEIEGPEGFVDMSAFERDRRTLAATARGIGRIWVTSLLPTLRNEPFSLPVVLTIRELGSQGAGLSARIHENIPASP